VNEKVVGPILYWPTSFLNMGLGVIYCFSQCCIYSHIKWVVKKDRCIISKGHIKDLQTRKKKRKNHYTLFMLAPEVILRFSDWSHRSVTFDGRCIYFITRANFRICL